MIQPYSTQYFKSDKWVLWTDEIISRDLSLRYDNDNDNDNESNFIAMNYIHHIIGDVQASSWKRNELVFVYIHMSFGLILYPVWSLDSDGVRDDTPSPGVYLKKYERNSRFVGLCWALLWFHCCGLSGFAVVHYRSIFVYTLLAWWLLKLRKQNYRSGKSTS